MPTVVRLGFYLEFFRLHTVVDGARPHGSPARRSGHRACPAGDEAQPCPLCTTGAHLAPRLEPHQAAASHLEASRRTRARRAARAGQTHRRLLRLADLFVVRVLEGLAVAEDAQVANTVRRLAEAPQRLLNPVAQSRACRQPQRVRASSGCLARAHALRGDASSL